MTTLNLAGKALTPGAQRSWWLREALGAEKDGEPRPLRGDINADVVVIGGGFTGLWTAYHLTLAKPDLKVVVLEQDICGGGPSGRNGGFASGWWDELDGLIALYGQDQAVRACRAIGESINAIGDFCATHGVVRGASTLATSTLRQPLNTTPSAPRSSTWRARSERLKSCKR